VLLKVKRWRLFATFNISFPESASPRAEEIQKLQRRTVLSIYLSIACNTDAEHSSKTDTA